MIQPIYLYGSEVLRAKAAEADLDKKEELKGLIGDLWDTLARAEGCGLAAPQIGIGLRVLVVDGDDGKAPRWDACCACMLQKIFLSDLLQPMYLCHRSSQNHRDDHYAHTFVS